MIKQVESFQHRKLAHLKQIEKSNILKTQIRLSQNQPHLLISKYDNLSNGEIYQHLLQIYNKNKNLTRNEVQYLWKRRAKLKEEYEAVQNERVFAEITKLTGLQMNEKAYRLLETKGWNKWRIKTVDKTIISQKRQYRPPGHHVSGARTLKQQRKVQLFTLKREGKIVLEGEAPVFYPKYRVNSYIEYLMQSFGHLNGYLERAVAERKKRLEEEKGEGI